MEADDDRAHLVEVLYADPRARAGRLVAHPAGSPTSLVHEAMERLYRVDPDRWRSPGHFEATAARGWLQELEEERPRCAEVVQLRALGGLEMEEIAPDGLRARRRRRRRTGRRRRAARSRRP